MLQKIKDFLATEKGKAALKTAKKVAGIVVVLFVAFKLYKRNKSKRF